MHDLGSKVDRGNNSGNKTASVKLRCPTQHTARCLKQQQPALVCAGWCRLRSRRSWVRIPPGASSYSRTSTARPGRDVHLRGSHVPDPRRIVSSPSPRHMADLLARVRASLAGRYTIERELGRGGMATVYLARDLKHDRPVALKVLAPSWRLSWAPSGSLERSASRRNSSTRTS